MAIFSMAYRSGMGRVVASLAFASGQLGETNLIAPPLDHEPSGVARTYFPRPTSHAGRISKLRALLAYNLRASVAVWKAVDRSSIFVMVDLFSTIPLSIMPLFAARLRGAKTVLNLHDFYPHTLRYPKHLQWLERWFFRAAYRQFDLIAAMTHSQADRLTREGSYPADKIVEISHGSFPIPNVVHHNPAEPSRILMLGSIRRNKHILTSIRALQAVSMHAEVTTRIAGAPRPEEQGYWAECSEELEGLPNAEVSPFFIPDEELPRTLSGVSAILCPYENFDSASGVGIVAVTNRIPLIATACAVPEELRNETGLWWRIEEPVSSATIRCAVESFLALDQAAREGLAQSAYDRFAQFDHWRDAIVAIRKALGVSRVSPL